MAAFYNEDIRRATAVFGSMFNNIELRAIDRSKGHETRDINGVALTNMPREKVLERALQGGRSGSENTVAMVLPIMAFEHKIGDLNQSRKLPANRRTRGVLVDPETRLNSRVPVPYNVTFELHIMTRHVDELLQIVEQILPKFQTSRTIYVKKFFNTEGVIKSDDFFSENMTFVLKNVATDYDYEGSSSDRRVNTAALEFSTVVNMYGEYSDQKMIRTADINYYAYKSYEPENPEPLGTIHVDGTNIADIEEYEQLLADDGISIQIITY